MLLKVGYALFYYFSSQHRLKAHYTFSTKIAFDQIITNLSIFTLFNRDDSILSFVCLLWGTLHDRLHLLLKCSSPLDSTIPPPFLVSLLSLWPLISTELLLLYHFKILCVLQSHSFNFLLFIYKLLVRKSLCSLMVQVLPTCWHFPNFYSWSRSVSWTPAP